MVTETVHDFGRPPEQGRIRFGIRQGRAMTSIDTFRFTSTDKGALEAIAGLYGGTVTAWSDPKASPKNQHQVITAASEVNVLLPPEDALTQWFECWGGGGLERRCDGEHMTLPVEGAPCACRMEGKRACKPHTRLRVLLPDVPFGGVWRLESKGWNAAEELASMEAFLSSIGQTGMPMMAVLYLEKRSKVVKGQTKNFHVPGLRVKHTITEIMQGEGTVRELGRIEVKHRELTATVEDIDDDQPETLADRGAQIVDEKGGDPVLDQIYARAAEIMVFRPGYADDDDDLVGKLIHHMSKGKMSDVVELAAKNRQQLIAYMDKIIAGEVELP